MARAKQAASRSSNDHPRFLADVPGRRRLQLYLAEHRLARVCDVPALRQSEVNRTPVRFRGAIPAVPPIGSRSRRHRFENTKLISGSGVSRHPLMLTSKKGTAPQVKVLWGSFVQTASYMCHPGASRMANEDFRKLIGIVEVDETFVGGQSQKSHWDSAAAAVAAAWDRARRPSSARSSARERSLPAHIDTVSSRDLLKTFVRGGGSRRSACWSTDEWVGYRGLDKEFPHAVIRHSAHQLRCRRIHTNTIEASGRSSKAALSAHSTRSVPISAALHRRIPVPYNNRQNEDIFGTAIRGC